MRPQRNRNNTQSQNTVAAMQSLPVSTQYTPVTDDKLMTNWLKLSKCATKTQLLNFTPIMSLRFKEAKPIAPANATPSTHRSQPV